MDENPYKPGIERGASLRARRERSGRMTGIQRIFALAIAAMQVVICLVIAFGDIGFDHPGHFGLDFDHFVFLLFLQALLCIWWLGFAIQQRRWILLSVPPVVVVATVAAIFIGD
jgi:hypothetical protein